MLSNREMQCLGAVCLLKFCRRFDIQHQALDETAVHLMTVLTAADLPAWENDGRNLVVCGRGEPLPKFVEEKVPTNRLGALEELIERIVEIGIIDMYGADTMQPLLQLHHAQRILSDNGVPLPDEKLFQIQSRPLRDRWGVPLSGTIYSDFVGRVIKLAG